MKQAIHAVAARHDAFARSGRVHQRRGAAALAGVLTLQTVAPAFAQGAPSFSARPAQADHQGATDGAMLQVAQTARQLAQQQAAGSRASARVDGDLLKGQAEAQANELLQEGVRLANQTELPFLRRLQGGVNYDFSNKDLSLDLRTIDEVHRGERDRVLLQLSGHNRNHRPTVNGGVVLRRAVNRHMAVGVNAFLDYEFGKSHLRGSLGGEAIAPQFTLYGNVYAPMSGWKAAKRAERREERPASGWDVGVRLQPEALPGLAIKGQYFRWNGAAVDYFDNGRPQRNARGYKYGVEYRPVPLVAVGLEQTKVLGGARQTTVQLGVNLSLGEPLSRQLRHQSGPAFDLQARMGEFVERENRIVLQTRRKHVVLPLTIARVDTDPATGRITVTGVTEPGAQVSLGLPNGEVVVAQADGSGTYRATSARDMVGGPVRARATNRHGDRSREVTHHYVDVAVKGEVPLTLGAVRTHPGTGVVTVTGKTGPGAKVRIDFPDGTFGDVVADNAGDFTVASEGDVAASGPIVAIARDDDGRESPRRTVQYDDRVNAGGSGAPTVVLHTDGSDGRVTVSGKGRPGDTIRVDFPDGTTKEVVAGPDGTYRVTSDRDMTAGDITVSGTDAKGNVGGPVKRPYHDIFVPVPPTVEVATDSSSGRVTVSGKATPRAKVKVDFPGGTSKTVTADADGRYRATSDGDVPGGDIVVTQTGMPGAAGKPVRRPYVDTVAPTPMKVTIDSMRTDGNSGVVTVTGYTIGGSTVTVTFPDGTTVSTTADDRGKYTVTSTADIPAGPIRVSARGPRNQQGSATDHYIDEWTKKTLLGGKIRLLRPVAGLSLSPGSMTYTEIAKSFDGSSLDGIVARFEPANGAPPQTAALLAAVKLHDPNYRLEPNKMFIYLDTMNSDPYNRVPNGDYPVTLVLEDKATGARESTAMVLKVTGSTYGKAPVVPGANGVLGTGAGPSLGGSLLIGGEGGLLGS